MAYTKQTWNSGDTITAEKLNHLEDGVANGGIVVTATTGASGVTLDKTWREIHDTALNGKSVWVAGAADIVAVKKIGYDSGGSNGYFVSTESDIFKTDSADGYPAVELIV